MSIRNGTAAASILLALTTARAADPADAVAAADTAWSARAEGATGDHAELKGAQGAVDSLKKAAAASPDSVALRWRLTRALFFLGEYALTEKEARKSALKEGRDVGEGTLDRLRKVCGPKLHKTDKELKEATPVDLVPCVKGDHDAIAAFVWSSYAWGQWALQEGKLAAVHQGAAPRIRDYATAVIALDPKFEGAAGERVLGRLHHQTPWVPFLTSWASKDKALEHLRRAVELAPESLINREYLAEALWEIEKKSRPEARKLLEGVMAATPDPAILVEERRAQVAAKEFLKEQGER